MGAGLVNIGGGGGSLLSKWWTWREPLPPQGQGVFESRFPFPEELADDGDMFMGDMPEVEDRVVLDLSNHMGDIALTSKGFGPSFGAQMTVDNPAVISSSGATQSALTPNTTSDQQSGLHTAKNSAFQGFQPNPASQAASPHPSVFAAQSASFGKPSAPASFGTKVFGSNPSQSAVSTSGFTPAPLSVSSNGFANGAVHSTTFSNSTPFSAGPGMNGTTAPNPFATATAPQSTGFQGNKPPAATINPFSGIQQKPAASSASNPFSKLLQKSDGVTSNPPQPQSGGFFSNPTLSVGISQPPSTNAPFATAQQPNGGQTMNMVQPPPPSIFNQGGASSPTPFASSSQPAFSQFGGLLVKSGTALNNAALPQSQIPASSQIASNSSPFSFLAQTKAQASTPNGDVSQPSVFPSTTKAQAGNPFGTSVQPSASQSISGHNAFASGTAPSQAPSPFVSGAFSAPSSSPHLNAHQKGAFSTPADTTAKNASRDKHRAEPPTMPAAPQNQYAKRIDDQLRSDGITAPKWPKNPGAPTSRGEMEKLRESTNSYRTKVRASLMKAGIIDDPTVQKDLKDAIDFKGICEGMCPDFEKMTRIVQFDVKAEEKTEAADGTMHPSTSHMVKAMARSAAGQDRPLPMDVLTIGALQRTLDYLIDEILVEDKNLPARHNFLWDRTRAVRRDFIFHSTKSPEELTQMVYCFENITRFHVTALHLLSQKSFAAPDFSEQQELEQLSKALLSLMETYDDCNKRDVQCANEAEFRAYFILLNSHKYQQTIGEWDSEVWYNSDDVQRAVSLAEAIQSVWDRDGPIRPSVPAAASGAFASYFRILEQPAVSYTMACFAEIHFTRVRRAILEDLVKAYSRGKQTPKDITVDVVNQKLRFDTEDEAVGFVTRHGLRFASEGADQKYLVLDRTVRIEKPTTRQSFSRRLVERKRGNRPLPEVIHTTVFEEPTVSPVTGADDAEGDIFVKQTPSLGGEKRQSKAKDVARNPTHTTTFPTPEQPKAVSSILKVPPATVTTPPTSAAGVSGIIAQPGSAFFSNPAAPPPPGPRAEAIPAAPFGIAPAKPVSVPTTSAPEGPSRASPIQEGKTVETTPRGSLTFSGTAPNPPAFSSILGGPTNAVSTAPSPFQSPAGKTTAPNITASPATPRFPITAADAKIGISTQEKATTPTPATLPTPQPSLLPASTIQQPPSIFSPAPEASTSKSSAAPSLPALASQTPPKAPALPLQPPPKSDPMGDFTKWVVLGDNGLLDEFQTAFTDHLLVSVFTQHQMEEEERNRREEDERSWAEARRFRQYSLGVKFFYRWRENARNKSLNRRIQQGNNALKAWQAQKAEERRDARKKAQAEAEADLESRRTSMESNYVEELRASVQQRKDKRMEEALLATGVLNGVRDERQVAAGIIRGALSATETQSSGSASPKIRQPHFHVLSSGMSRSASRVKNILSRSTSIRKAYDTKAGSMSPPSEGTRSLRQSFTSKLRIPSLGRSSPPTTGRRTNFSRLSASTSTDRDARGSNLSQEKSNVRSNHWKLRAMGMIQMPNKQYLHESLAIPMLEGKRFPGIGTYGLPPVEKDSGLASDDMEHSSTGPVTAGLAQQPPFEHVRHHSISPPNKRKRTPDGEEGGHGYDGESPPGAKKPRSFDADEAQTRLRAPKKEAAHPISASPPNQESRLASQSPPNKRKRGHDDDEAEHAESADDTQPTGNRPASSITKKHKGYDRTEAEKVLREMRELGAQMDADKEWFREQNEMMEKGVSPWDR